MVPEHATLNGTIRYFKDEVADLVKERMTKICDGLALAYGAEIKIAFRDIFNVLINDDKLSDAYMDAAADILGPENVSDDAAPATGSEDFADMLQVVPGAYCRIGHTGTIGLHNPAFVLGQEILTQGASVMARLVEKRLALS